LFVWRKCPHRAGDDMVEWNTLSECAQLALAREALSRASEAIAGQAEVLADEMESGGLPDRGGPGALRLLAAVVRANGERIQVPAGHA